MLGERTCTSAMSGAATNTVEAGPGSFSAVPLLTSSVSVGASVGTIWLWANGRTVAEVFAQRAQLDGKPVAVRGKVVKFLPGIMGRVAQKLRAELKPGTRIVVHDFPRPGWPVDRVEAFDVPEKRDYTFYERATIYLYTMPQRTVSR